MSKFSKTAPTTKSKFRKTERPLSASELEQTNKNAVATISRYQEVMNNNGYMSAEDLSAYTSAVNAYVGTGNRLRENNRQMGAVYSEADESRWQKTVAQLSVSSGKAHDRYSEYKNEDSYKEAQDSAQLRAEKLSFDTVVGQQELDALIAMQTEYDQKDQELKQYLLNPEVSGLSEHQAMALDKWLRETEAQYGFSGADGLKGMITTKTAYLNDAKRLQTWDALGAVGNPEREEYDPEFDQYTGYVSTVSGESSYGQLNYDPEYEAVNNKSSSVSMATISAEISSIYSNPNNQYDVAYLDYLTYLESLTQMSAEEVATYNYYYAKHGKKAAHEYLESIQESLNSLVAEKNFEDFKGNVILEELYAAPAALDQFKGNMASLFNTEGAYRPTSSAQYLSGMVREDLAEVGHELPEWLGGASLGQGVYDAISTTTYMAPSILVSTAVGLANKTAGAVVGSMLIGASSAGGAYQEKLNAGYSQEQAATYGTLVGASEATLQYLLGGIGKFGGKLTKAALKNLSKIDGIFSAIAESTGGRLLANGLSEAMEEYLQAMLEPYLWEAISGEEMTADQSEALYNALLGFATGFLFEGGEVIADNHRYASSGREIIKGGRLSGLQELAAEFAGTDSKIAKIASQVSDKSSGKNAWQVGRLYRAVTEAVGKQNRTVLTNSLIQKGVNTETAGKLAEVTTQWWIGGELSDAGLELISAAVSDPEITEAISEVHGQMMPVIERLGQIRKGKAAVSTATEEGKQNAATLAERNGAAFADTVMENGRFVESSGAAVESVMESQDHTQQNVEEKIFLQSSGEEVQSVAYKSIDNGRVTVTVNGSTEAAAGDVSFSNEGDAVLFESIPAINHITAEGANVIWNAWKSGGQSNAGAFGGAAAQVFKAGYLGDATILNAGDSRAAALTSAQKYAIYQQGRKAAAADYDSKQAKRYADNKKPAKEKKGGVYYGYDGKTIDQRNDGKHKPLTKAQRVGIEFVKRLSKKFGSTVYFYESYIDENGNRVYKDRNGNVVAAEKGFYNPKDGSIHIDLNSGKVLYTIAHELVHFIRDWSPKHFKQMADIVMAGYSRENVPLDKLIADQQALAKEHGRELTEDEAFEEVIANALEGVMADGKVAEFLRAIEGKDKSLGAKVRQFFQDIAKLIQDALDACAGVKPDSVEGKMTMQLEDVYRQLQQVFAEGVHQSGENFRRAEKNTTGEGGVRHSISGPESRTADIQSLAQAKKQLRNGTDSEVIRKETGWFQGYDGMWRYEISDKDMEIDTHGKFHTNPDIRRYTELVNKIYFGDSTATDADVQELRTLKQNLKGVNMEPSKLGQLIKHDALFFAYPQLKDIEIKFDDIKERGKYSPASKTITLLKNLKADKTQLAKTLVHEIQHAIQDIEGFTGGASIEYWRNMGIPENKLAEYYGKTAGEVEARDVVARKDLSSNAIKENRPDIDRTDVVFADKSAVSKDFVGWTIDGNEVYLTSQNIQSLSISDRIAKFKADFAKDYEGRTAKFMRNGHTHYAHFSKDSSTFGKLTYEGNAKSSRSSQSGYKAKIRMLADGTIFELVEDATYKNTAPESGGKNISHKDAKYWDYFIKTVIVDGKAYDVLISVRLDDASGNWTAKERYVYSIRFRDNKTAATSVASPASSKVLHQGDVAATNMVADRNAVVNPNSTTDSDGVKRSVQQKENATVADMLKKENEKLKVEESGGNEHLTDRQILEYALKTVDRETIDRHFLRALKTYARQVEHTKTTEKLLSQLEKKRQQYRGVNENTEEISRINGAISKLKSMLSAQEKKRTAAEKGKKLQKVIKMLRAGFGEAQSTVENSRNKKLDNYRTNDKINADDGSQQGAVDRTENTTAQNKTLTAQDLLDRIDEFVNVRTLSDKQQNALDAYKQQKQTISELEASRKTHENPEELDSQIAKAKEKLQKIQERKVTKSIVNRAKQSIYHEYAGEAIKRAHLQKRLASQQAVLDALYARLNSIKTIDAETISPENMEIQDEIAKQEWLLDDIKDKLVNTEKSLTVAKSRASAIVDSNDRGVLLFDDRSILEVGGKYVVVFNELFDPDHVDKKGRTNLDRLRLGLAPIGYDNKSINIHHIDQTDDGVLMMIPESLHRKYDSMLHSNKGQSPSQIDRAAFEKWKRSFWKWVLQSQNEQNQQLEGNYELSGFSESNGIGTEVQIL